MPISLFSIEIFVERLRNGVREKKTENDSANPSTVLVARKACKKIEPGQTVTLVVRNSDNTDSNTYLFTRPV